MLKIDLHVHSTYSNDSILTLREIYNAYKKFNLLVAITDHNSFEGAIKYRKKYNQVIMGQEIRTDKGDIIGLFLNQQIVATEISEVIDEIKAQGGLVYLPHPFDNLRKSTINLKDLPRDILKKIDILEIFNSRTFPKKANELARKYAKRRCLIAGVGSDAHTFPEIGTSYIKMFEFDSPKEFLENLRDAKLVMRSTPLFFRVISKIITKIMLYSK